MKGTVLGNTGIRVKGQRIRDKTYLEFDTEDQVLLNLVIETYLRVQLKSSLTIFLMKVGSSDAPFYKNSAKNRFFITLSFL